MTNSFSWVRLRGGIVAVLATLGLVLFARPTLAQDKGTKTAEYWNKIKAIQDEAAPPDDATVDQKIDALRSMAKDIDDLSARGVDEEALDVADQLVKVANRLADFLDDYGDADRAFKSGLRDGLNNNPTRALDEAAAVKQDVTDFKEAQSKVRKRLEGRYDVDLPSLWNN
jgi:hypothetical protein